MTASAIDWRTISGLSGTSLKSHVFDAFRAASSDLQNAPTDDPTLLGVVPRLAELIENREELANFAEPLSALARATGLWNYIDTKVADKRDELAAEVARIPQLGIVLHREQMAALNTLLSGQNLILSAPTSFGKSILVDALLLHKRYRRVAIVLPTIALLDEFRRRLVHTFGSEYDILMTHSEMPVRERVIYLGTQERLISRDDLKDLDLVVVDEFYKLDPTRRDDRSVTLNAAVYRLLNNAKQFFFLGPNIDNVTTADDKRWSFQFLRTRFSTVAVDTLDLKGVRDKKERLHEEVKKKDNWPALVFISSPDRANDLAAEMLANNFQAGDGAAFAAWMADNYGSKWTLPAAVASGVGVHHGRIPRSLASRFVTLFNREALPVLICTATLIEGVNTAAKSVLIFDKAIDRKSYDFFTFSNIRGRAGRLGQHHVGHVYLFHNPPNQEDVDVSAPLFGVYDDAPDELVVHLEERHTSKVTTERVQDIGNRIGLSRAELRRFSSIGIEIIDKLKLLTYTALSEHADLRWAQYPTYNQILALCQIVCGVKRPTDFGFYSYKQLAFYISKLREVSSLRQFFLFHASSYEGEPKRFDYIFKFLRACEYNLPEYFGVIELFVKKAFPQVNYSLLLGELPRWFRPEALKILEEQGVPIQISERFLAPNDTVASLGARLRNLALAKDRRLSPLERDWILDALPA